MARALMFSVIIPSRNRTRLLKQALASVTSQKGDGFEVIVMNDGTERREKIELGELKAAYARRVRFLDLPATASGNGCFRVMNTGAFAAWGDYLCFLDDDDEWTDQAHLADARRIINASSPDVIVFDQEAYRGPDKASGPIWLEDLGKRLHDQSNPGPDGSFRITSDDLLSGPLHSPSCHRQQPLNGARGRPGQLHLERLSPRRQDQSDEARGRRIHSSLPAAHRA